MLDRRAFLASSSAAIAVAAVGGFAPLVAQDGAETRDAALDRLLTGWFNEDIRENPTYATALGLDPTAAKIVVVKEKDKSLAEDRIEVKGAGAKLRFIAGQVFVAYVIEGSGAEAAGREGRAETGRSEKDRNRFYEAERKRRQGRADEVSAAG